MLAVARAAISDRVELVVKLVLLDNGCSARVRYSSGLVAVRLVRVSLNGFCSTVCQVSNA
jgi:hypothetical protein